MTTSGNQSSDGDRIEARSPTDQRDTPDTRTPSAEGCGHDRHTSGASGIRWGHVPDDDGPTPWEPCSEPAPLGDAKGLVSDPTPVGTSDALPRSLTTGVEPTDDVAALVERLRAAPLVNGGTLHAEAADALEDLTRKRDALLRDRNDAAGVLMALFPDAAQDGTAHNAALVAKSGIQDLTRENERLAADLAAARAERDTIGARALDTLIEGGRCARRALRAEAQVEELNERNSSDLRRLDALVAQVAAVRAEMDHAFLNDHVLDRDCQGVAPGERVPAVRIDHIVAALAVRAPETETTP